MNKQLAKAPSLDWRSIDRVVAIPLGSWRAARAMFQARGDRSGSRMAYAQGVLERLARHASMEDQSKAVRAFLKLRR